MIQNTVNKYTISLTYQHIYRLTEPLCPPTAARQVTKSIVHPLLACLLACLIWLNVGFTQVEPTSTHCWQRRHDFMPRAALFTFLWCDHSASSLVWQYTHTHTQTQSVIREGCASSSIATPLKWTLMKRGCNCKHCTSVRRRVVRRPPLFRRGPSKSGAQEGRTEKDF